MSYKLIIAHGSNVYQPSIVDDIVWETERKGTPGKLTFKIIGNDKIQFTEGDSVSFKLGKNDTPIFYGFIFSIKRDKEQILSITAYDQLRYLKNKDTVQIKNMTATETIEMLAKDFQLQTGKLTNTKFKIESKLEDNQTLFDIIQNALDLTLHNTKELYVLYDDFGKITLKNISEMKLNVALDETSAENFDYETSIDQNTYNQIKLVYNNETEGKREIYLAKDGSNINQWGVLQYFETLNEKGNAKNKADTLLKLYNQKTKNFTLKNVFGHTDVRAGSLIGVSLNLGDEKINNYMLVESCKHTFSENLHTMDLVLKGDGF